MTPQLISLASPSTSGRATPEHAVLVWGDDAYARRSWAAALADEGVAVDTRAVDDLSLPLRQDDAWVLHISNGLSANLSRLRTIQAMPVAPPLMVAARGLREMDQVLALEMGADDVVDTSLGAPVVAARLRALWRRAHRQAASEEPNELCFGALRLSRHEREVRLGGAVVPLTASTALSGVKQILILVEKNPSALIAVFNVTDSVEANFATRAKMGQSSDVYAVAIMNDGKVLFAKKEVKVTLGGCGG